MRKSSVRFRAHSIALLAALSAATGARADPLQDLQEQVREVTKKVDDLEHRAMPPHDAAAPGAGGNAVTGGATRGSFRLPGSDTSVTLGGYVKFDAVYSDKSAGVGSTADQQYEAGAVPVGPNAGANEKGQLKLHARQSRFWIGTSAPSAWGELKTHLEFDLFGASGNESVSNSHGLRVRHAYGTLGRLLAGQTWTTFSDPATYPETLDFGGPAGTIFARQAQIRWTQPFALGQWSVALENPETVATLPGGATFRADDDRLPDLAANVRFDASRGHTTIAGLVRQLRVDSAADPAVRSQKVGWGAGVNAVFAALGSDDVRLSAYYGNALGRYTLGFFTDALVDAGGELALANQWTASAAYRHFWSPGLRSTLALSGLRAANPAGTAAPVNRSAQSAHVNLIWSPVERANLGVEYLVARREIEDGSTGTLHRVQLSTQYLF